MPQPMNPIVGNPIAANATQPLGVMPPNPAQKQGPTPPKPKMPRPQAAQQQPQMPQQQMPQPPAFAQGGMVQPQMPQPPQGPAKAPPMPGITRHTDAPIPGQSLTSKPGSFPFEHPPKYTDPDKAIAAILNAVTEEDTAIKLLNLMELGVPVYTICMSMMMNGFAEGKWNLDLGLVLLEPMTAIMIRMAEAAGITPEIGVPEEADKTLDLVAQRRVKISEEQADAAIDAARTGGIMSRPGRA
jgi:hypothetical protein